jgi:hypothetical protein
MQYERKPTPKGMILDICSMRSRAIKLLKNTNEYNSLLETITAKDYYYDEDLQFPSLKQFAEMAGIKYDKARRQLIKIYNDLCSFEFIESTPFEFKETEIWIGLKGIYESKTFQVNHLPYLPRRGETVQIRFFKELIGTDYFYVEKIYHELEDNKQKIFLSLNYGSYNSYWQLRKDQAEELGEISWHDRTTKSDYQLKDQLDLRPGKAW